MTDDPPRYRIEHRRRVLPPRILAFADTLVMAQAALVLHASRLRQERAHGSVALVDMRTQRVVEEQAIAPASEGE
jgi:hypothetical protein